MADSELAGWSESYRKVNEVPAALSRDVGRQARLRRLAGGFIALTATFESCVGVALLLTDPSAHARWMAAFLITVSGVMAAAFFRTQRGLWRTSALATGALLELLERRIDAGLTLTRVIPWFGAAALVAMIALVLSSEAPPQDKVLGILFAGLVCAFTFAAPALARRRLQARRAVLARWRTEVGSA